MNITLLVNEEVFTYNLIESKIVDWEPTYLCLNFDNYPSKLEIETEFLKLFNFSGIKAEYRGYLTVVTDKVEMPWGRDSNFRSFLREAFNNEWEDEKVSSIKDFLIEAPNLNNNAHRHILENLPNLDIEINSYNKPKDLKAFFARKFQCNYDCIVVLPNIDYFVKHYLCEYLSYSSNNTAAKYWESDEGKGKLLAAAF